MGADREREIRELQAQLATSKRHRRIALVIADLLAEIDALRRTAECGTSFAQ